MARRVKFIPEGYYTIKSLPTGEYFKRTIGARKVYARGYFNGKTYDCIAVENMNEGISLKGSTIVYSGFTY